MKIIIHVLLMLITALFVCGVSNAQEHESGDGPAYMIIINEANPTTSMARSGVAKLFLKKSGKWGDGVKALPVDQHEESVIREAFSKNVLHKSVSSVISYWQQQVFSGRAIPPPEKATDEEILIYVKANRGAIGYVRGDTVAAGVKVIDVLD